MLEFIRAMFADILDLGSSEVGIDARQLSTRPSRVFGPDRPAVAHEMQSRDEAVKNARASIARRYPTERIRKSIADTIAAPQPL